jgi:hypothetical protein
MHKSSTAAQLAGDEMLTAEVSKRRATLVSRRSFVTALAVAGAATGVTGCGDGSLPNPISTLYVPSVVDVLNFALNLEYFEASFYSYITTGAGINSSLLGSSPGTVTGGAKATLVNNNVQLVANQLATDEVEHVTFLRSTITSIGGTPISIPNINLAAGGAVTNDATFLAAARRFETVGISAYAGGAQYLVSNTVGLTYAAQILDTEAQHEGFLRELCINYNVTSAPVDGADIAPTASTVFNTNSSGLNAVRTPSQVLQILYAAPGQTGVTSGGFFPNGLNGNIAST